MTTTAVASPRFAFHDGEFVRADTVGLPVSTQALHYGTGVFEGIRAYAREGTAGLSVFRLREHLERLERSAGALRIRLPLTVDRMSNVVLDLLRRNGGDGDTYIRPLAYKLALEPGTPFGVRLSGVSAQFTLTTVRMGSYVRSEGLACKVSSFRRVPSVSIPSTAKITGTYANNALAVEEAYADGCDDALMLGLDGNLTEASTSNVFVVGRDGRIATPPVTADILPGITRATVIELLAREFGLPVAERPVGRAELDDAQEVFTTGTGVEVSAVTSIDHRPVGTGRAGDLTRRLRDVYTEVVRGRRPAYATWLTPVPLR
ncbi:branched-chain amino acid transaminase [Streptomyces sp. NPDC006415]|uniref:branched-chain amino acid transaminase n=1 Tax=Streptomyces sp. NPDC006415 TaxID=3155351 RepID=UPI0033ABD7A8